MEQSIGEKQSQTTGLKKLRMGFILSLASFILVFLGLFWVLSAWGVFLALLAWAYGALSRSRGWNLAGLKHTGSVLNYAWQINLVVCLPLPLLLSSSSPALFLLNPYLVLSIAGVTTVVWGYSTICEAKGLKKLETDTKVSLKLSRYCSLTGVIVYASSNLLYSYLALVNLGMPSLVFPFLPYYFIPLNSLLFASPFLMASCVNAIFRLKKAIIQPSLAPTQPLF